VRWRRKDGEHDGRIDSGEQRGSRAVIGFSGADRENKRHDCAHVLELREGKIFAIRDYASPSRAALATRLPAVLSI
jgi:ketosteroid isomerase-like protein